MRFWAIYDALRDHQGDDPAPRLMKLSEEVGEVVQAFIGFKGWNKRKGYTHTAKDVADELCDVIITAQVALNDWVEDPELYFKNHAEKIARRVKKDGS